MVLSTFILLIVWLINLSLLLFILAQKNKPRRWPIFVMIALMSVWQASELVNIFFLTDSPDLMTGVRFGLLPTLYLAPAWIWLVLSLFNKWPRQSIFKRWLWFAPAILMSPFVFTDFNVSQVIIRQGEIHYVPGKIYFVFAFYFGSLMAYGLYLLIRHRRQADSIVRRQIDYIFVATALTALLALLLNIFLPLLGIGGLYYIGVNVSVLFTTIVAYALFHHQFYDLRISFYKIVVDLFRLLITGIFFYFLYQLLQDTIGVDFALASNLIIWLLVLGVLGPLVFAWVARVVDYFLADPAQNYEKVLEDIAVILRTSQDLNFLLAGLAKEISHIIDYNDFYLYLSKRNQPQVFYQVFPAGERILNTNSSHLLQSLVKDKKIVLTAELEYWQKNQELLAELKVGHIDIALPIFYNQQLLGALLIDNKNKLLSVQQLEFLEGVNKYLDIAIGSLLLYQQAL
ncbi:MAG: histidine kinase N-terminal 7TM domain-containing protein, partial [Patescibacteria group bacterium]